MEVHITADRKVFGHPEAKARYNCIWDQTAYRKTVPTNLPYPNSDPGWPVCRTPVWKKNIIEFDSFRSAEKGLSTAVIR